jgi:outer membrane protein OmpA-like peptidoglycan-associated protein
VKAFLLVFLVFVPSMASAANIYPMRYTHVFDGIARDGAHRETFVVCEGVCVTAPSLVRAPKSLALSVRLSQDKTGESVPGTTPAAGMLAKAETSRKPASQEKSDLPLPAIQDLAPKRTSVLFAIDTFALDASQMAKLSSLVAVAHDRKDLSVSVEGFTCDLGSQAHNDALAKKRAETVALYLEKVGMRPTRVTGMGRCCYVTEEADKRSLNRRVEITIDKGETR